MAKKRRISAEIGVNKTEFTFGNSQLNNTKIQCYLISHIKMEIKKKARFYKK